MIFVCDRTRAELLKNGLNQNNCVVLAEKNCALLSAVGDGLGSCPDLLPQFLLALEGAKITPLLIGRSALSLTVVVDEKEKELGVRTLHQAFVEGGLNGPNLPIEGKKEPPPTFQ